MTATTRWECLLGERRHCSNFHPLVYHVAKTNMMTMSLEVKEFSIAGVFVLLLEYRLWLMSVGVGFERRPAKWLR